MTINLTMPLLFNGSLPNVPWNDSTLLTSVDFFHKPDVAIIALYVVVLTASLSANTLLIFIVIKFQYMRRFSLKARQAAAVAAFKRRQYEQQVALSKQLAEVEESELIAELLKAESRSLRNHSRCSKTNRKKHRRPLSSMCLSEEGVSRKPKNNEKSSHCHRKKRKRPLPSVWLSSNPPRKIHTGKKKKCRQKKKDCD